jgi:hypothetical protein
MAQKSREWYGEELKAQSGFAAKAQWRRVQCGEGGGNRQTATPNVRCIECSRPGYHGWPMGGWVPASPAVGVPRDV